MSHSAYCFGRDLIRYVLHEYYKGSSWRPVGNFAATDERSPFTSNVQLMIKDFLDSTGAEIQELHDKDFPSKDITNRDYVGILSRYKDLHFVDGYNCDTFLQFSAFLGAFCAISYMCGFSDAPSATLRFICDSIKEWRLLDTDKFSDEGNWNELDIYCNVELSNSRKITLNHQK